jgi:hypothetical protein
MPRVVMKTAPVHPILNSNMLLKRISHYIRNHDWFAVLVELLIIIIGLMMAFQLDRWREANVDRERERVYIDHLINDIETDLPDIGYAIELQSMRLVLINMLMDIADSPDKEVEYPVLFLGAIDQAAYTYTPTLTNHTFENLRATGDMQLIRSEDVKDVLFEYYNYDQEQRQYRPLQFMTESRHFELAAGVLDKEQIVFVQDNYLFFRPTEIDEVKALEFDRDGIRQAAGRLAERADLVAWLPYVRSMQLEQIEVHHMRLDRARKALEVLQEYAR